MGFCGADVERTLENIIRMMCGGRMVSSAFYLQRQLVEIQAAPKQDCDQLRLICSSRGLVGMYSTVIGSWAAADICRLGIFARSYCTHDFHHNHHHPLPADGTKYRLASMEA